MTLKEIRSDIMLLLSKSTQSKNFRIKDAQVDYKIHEKRARGIREEAHRNEEFISPSWIQDMGMMPVTLITSADDPSVLPSCKTIGKISIPQVVDLPEDRGVYRVSSSSKIRPFYPIEPSRFFDIVPGSTYDKFQYYTRIGTSLYLRNPTPEISVELLLDNPLDGVVLRTARVSSGYLTIGDSFKVLTGSVTYNGVTYYSNATFTAVNKNFTGDGTVEYSVKKRKMTEDDAYPLSFTLTEYIIMKILTQDYKIEASQVADVINDSQDQLIAMQPPRQ